MPRIKLTDSAIAKASLPEGRSEVILWDTELTGFGIRIGEKSRTFIVSYRPAGAGRAANSKKLKVGPAEAFKTTAEARNAARVLLGRVASGVDPAAERAEQKRREKSKLADVLDAYERDLNRRQYVNAKVVMSGLRSRLVKHMQADIAELKGADLAGIIERLESAGKAGAAQDFRSRVRAFLAFAVTKAKVIEQNPLAGYRKQRATRADRVAKAQHGRALSDQELASVWRAADPTTNFGRLVRFLILTGCRRGEGAGLRRSMIAGDVIEFPAVFVKQGREHYVPIAPALAAHLEACPVDARDPDLVFASPRSGGVIGGWTQLVAGLEKKSGVSFDLHDLRRTFRTGLSRLGVETDLAELALGHAREDLVRIYNRDSALAELRKIFERWAEHVQVIVASA
ncbi:hypothetical protein SLNSH_02715 [Alsobacter soli]|uniref:Tyr recombinase domain-containing protein n=1 Tax=Alsobacter soli TaxID=2109933 RepID=A0A2T1HYN1_9HYPH|nr:integrase arm-type DNA-binding domain-containing protein [Alsobacter soli]PSC06725.1 hypothetical protein SLNSH_02715 [Alsobacter soli]